MNYAHGDHDPARQDAGRPRRRLPRLAHLARPRRQGTDKGWYATRWGQRLTAEELDAGLAATLSADDSASLQDLLTQQLVIQDGQQAVRHEIP